MQGEKLYYRDQYQFVTNYTTSKTWISTTETIFQETHCLGNLTWIKKSSLSRDHNSSQTYAKVN